MNWDLIKSLFAYDTIQAISRLRSLNQNLVDKLIRISNKSGEFLIKSAYKMLY